jgi:hypothetical protein
VGQLKGDQVIDLLFLLIFIDITTGQRGH